MMTNSAGRSDLVDISAELKHETDKAFLIFDGDKEIWIPKSLVEYDASGDRDPRFGIFTMPEWLAMDKGLI